MINNDRWPIDWSILIQKAQWVTASKEISSIWVIGWAGLGNSLSPLVNMSRSAHRGTLQSIGSHFG